VSLCAFFDSRVHTCSLFLKLTRSTCICQLGLDMGSIRDTLLEIQRGDVRCPSYDGGENGHSGGEIKHKDTREFKVVRPVGV
jgi:hypothetical protein